MSISDMLDIMLIIVIILYAFIHGCKIAYEKGVEDGRESGRLRQLLRDIDFINKLKGKHINNEDNGTENR